MKPILDPASGSRKFYFDKENPLVLFGDIRNVAYTQCDGRVLKVNPDMRIDFKNLPFADETFSLVVFDPPHLYRAGPDSYTAQSYGLLQKETWREEIQAGFKECWRVLKQQGTLIFKWSDNDIPLKDVLKLFRPVRPLLGDKKVTSARKVNRFWLVFFKP